MDSDDLPVGGILTRREVMKVLTASGVATLVGFELGSRGVNDILAAVPSCTVRPEMTTGPYFIDHQLQRSDIRPEPSTGVVTAGVPLALTFNVSQVGGGSCKPLADAIIDVWHCDASGAYSGVSDARMGFDTSGQKFLRGFQATSHDGRAEFQTIYPGWYPGRAVHIHFKIRSSAAPAGAYEFTSQLFFEEALTDRVHAETPYAGHRGRRTMNAADGIFRGGGRTMVLSPTRTSTGYAAAFDIALDLSEGGNGGGRGTGTSNNGETEERRRTEYI